MTGRCRLACTRYRGVPKVRVEFIFTGFLLRCQMEGLFWGWGRWFWLGEGEERPAFVLSRRHGGHGVLFSSFSVRVRLWASPFLFSHGGTENTEFYGITTKKRNKPSKRLQAGLRSTTLVADGREKRVCCELLVVMVPSRVSVSLPAPEPLSRQQCKAPQIQDTAQHC